VLRELACGGYEKKKKQNGTECPRPPTRVDKYETVGDGRKKLTKIERRSGWSEGYEI
jgi:hypothetical protein